MRHGLLLLRRNIQELGDRGQAREEVDQTYQGHADYVTDISAWTVPTLDFWSEPHPLHKGDQAAHASM